MKNDFKIMGDITVIFLRRHDGTIMETIIDTSSLPLIEMHPYRWCTTRSGSRKEFYVLSYIPNNGKSKSILLHRLLLNYPEGLDVDHINHNSLDNRLCNLRAITHAENLQNRAGSQSNNTGSQYRGVNYKKRSNKWNARLRINGKQYSFGYYNTPEEANEVITKARAELMPFSQEVQP